MNKRRFSNKNLEEAIEEAARFFEVDKNFLCYQVIQNAPTGLLSRLFFRSVLIEAWVETPLADLQAAAREVVRQTLDKTKVSPQFRTALELDNPQVAALFHEYKEMFFGAFALNPSSVQTVMSDHEVKVLVQDAHFEDFLSKSDRLSLAFEHIFKRIAQKKLGDIYVRMVLDAGRSSEKREERLVGIARVLAEKVRKTGKSAVLSSKSSQERRVIHLALDGFAGVVTRSVGTGEKRRLVIAASHKKSIGVEKAAYRRYKKKPCSKSGNEKKWLQNEE